MKMFSLRQVEWHIQLAIPHLAVERKLKELETGFIQGLEMHNKKKH